MTERIKNSKLPALALLTTMLLAGCKGMEKTIPLPNAEDSLSPKEKAELKRHTQKVSEVMVGATWEQLIVEGEKEMKADHPDDAEPLLMRAWQETQSLKRDAARLGRTLTDLGTVHTQQGKYILAVLDLKRAIEAIEKQETTSSQEGKPEKAKPALPDNENRLANAYFSLGNAYARQNKFDDARQNFQQALELYAAKPALAHPKSEWLQNELDYADRTENKFSQAQEMYTKVIDKYKGKESDKNWAVALCQERIAKLSGHADKPAKEPESK